MRTKDNLALAGFVSSKKAERAILLVTKPTIAKKLIELPSGISTYMNQILIAFPSTALPS
jgi:hypothetical protein